MEADPGFKQVIPYLVLRDGERYFLMRRTRAGGDVRLHDRWSIGVGGHLNPGDGDLDGGLRREWSEELVADFVPEFRFVGLLNDDTTAVGQVHLGAVFVADAAGRPVAIRETDKLSGRVRDARRGRRGGATDLETWSRLVFDALASAGGTMNRRGSPDEPPSRRQDRLRRRPSCWGCSGCRSAVARGPPTAGDVVVLTADGRRRQRHGRLPRARASPGPRPTAPRRSSSAEHAGRRRSTRRTRSSARCSRPTSRRSSGSRRPAAARRAPGRSSRSPAHLALMAPGTNIGAASPVLAGGEDIPETLRDKVFNDTIAKIRAIAEERGRNVDWAVSTVEKAVSSPASEAVEVGRRRRHRRVARRRARIRQRPRGHGRRRSRSRWTSPARRPRTSR